MNPVYHPLFLLASFASLDFSLAALLGWITLFFAARSRILAAWLRSFLVGLVRACFRIFFSRRRMHLLMTVLRRSLRKAFLADLVTGIVNRV